MISKYKQGICSGCGKEKLIIVKSKRLCYYCKLKESIKRTKERKIKKGKYIDYDKLGTFYKQFYEQHPTRRCFESGQPIYNGKPWNCHHVLEKKHYPEHIFNSDVCVLLTLELHSLWHTLSDEDRATKMPKTYARYLELLEKYNIKN